MANGISDFIYRSGALLRDSSHLPIEVLSRLKLNAKYLLQCKNPDDNNQKLKEVISKVDERVEIIYKQATVESEQHSSLSSSQGVTEEGSTRNTITQSSDANNPTNNSTPSLSLTNKSKHANTKYNITNDIIEPNSSTSTTSAVKLQSLLKQQKVRHLDNKVAILVCFHIYYSSNLTSDLLLLTGSYCSRGRGRGN